MTVNFDDEDPHDPGALGDFALGRRESPATWWFLAQVAATAVVGVVSAVAWLQGSAFTWFQGSARAPLLVVSTAAVIASGINLAKRWEGKKQRWREEDDLARERRRELVIATRPLARLGEEVAAFPPGERPDRRREAADEAVAALLALLPDIDGLRILVLTFDSAESLGDPSTLTTDSVGDQGAVAAQRSLPWRMSTLAHHGFETPPPPIVEGTVDAGTAFRLIDRDHAVLVRDLRSDIESGLSFSLADGHLTSIVAPLVVTTATHTMTFGLLVVDAPVPGSLTEPHRRVTAVIARLLAIPFALQTAGSREP